MNFELTEEQLSVQQAARDFAITELLPGVIERDNEQRFPVTENMIEFFFYKNNKLFHN